MSLHYVRQLVVAVSPQLAAVSVGGAVSYPSVLLQQFSANDTTIHFDMDTASWIGSIHGLAGIPSILIPSLTQWRGRKFAFIIACLILLIGWTLAFTATTPMSILISESFHGLGTNSILAVSLLCISEMLAPQFRNVSMFTYLMTQGVGMVLVGILGRFLHWKTVSIIMAVPLVIAILMALMWPESPSWLACRGKFDKCEQAFIWLRGTDQTAAKELEELITAQRGNLVRLNKKSKLNKIWHTLTSRDFYLPSLHVFLLLNLMYWSGSLVIIIYSIQMIGNATNNADIASYGCIILNSVIVVGDVICAVLIRKFNNKTVLLFSTFCTIVSLLCTSAVNYMQSVDVISKDSLLGLYCLMSYTIAISLGILQLAHPIAVELMPVKHRGIGGALYEIFTCILHTSSLKFAPYLFLHINLWGTLLLFAINASVCGLLIWRYVPETKGKTLQQLENYYMFGDFDKSDDLEGEKQLFKMELCDC